MTYHVLQKRHAKGVYCMSSLRKLMSTKGASVKLHHQSGPETADGTSPSYCSAIDV